MVRFAIIRNEYKLEYYQKCFSKLTQNEQEK